LLNIYIRDDFDLPDFKEIAMRPVGRILVIVVILPALPAQAQTYDPRYPICMQVFSIDGPAIGCGYTTMAQCKASASGRAAECFANPYFAGASRKPPVRARRR
jgi:Protein of unknown function (DUF3551)